MSELAFSNAFVTSANHLTFSLRVWYFCNRAKRWAINVRREDLVDKTPEYLNKNCFVCAEHFERPMFLNDLRNRLQPTAVPTLLDVRFPPPTVFSSRRKHSLTDRPSTAGSLSSKRRRIFRGSAVESLPLTVEPTSCGADVANSLLVRPNAIIEPSAGPEQSATNEFTQTSGNLSSGTLRKERLRKIIHVARVTLYY
jgi:THAP domain